MNRKRTLNKKNQWSSAAARRLLEMAGQPPSIEDAVRIVAKRYLDGVACPPTDLNAIADRVCVTEIFGEDLPVSGELRRDGKNLKIVYSTYLSPTRKRFTIAHELGHAIFEGTGARAPRTGDELERLCDMLASEILMPRDIFLSLANGDPSLSHLLEVAHTFKTSLSATSIRYAKLKKVSIFYLEENNITWGCGTVKKGSLNSLDYSLRLAVAGAVNGERIPDTIFLSRQEWCGEWQLDYKPLSDGKRALFMLRPALQTSRGNYSPAG